MFIISGTMRPQFDGEIKPDSVSQSATYDGDEALYGAHHAVDGDLATQALTTKGAYVNAWFKARLGAGYCVQKVLHYWGPELSQVDTQTCSRSLCTCEGYQCSRWVLSVYYEDGRAPSYSSLSDTGCKVGDTVEIKTIDSADSLDIDELAIIGKGKSSN